MEKKTVKHMNPYLAGFFLGLVLLAAFYLSGRGLGASGALKNVVVSIVNAVNPEHAESSAFYSQYLGGEFGPMKSWLVFLALGVVVGSFFSGAVSDRLKFKIERGPRLSAGGRILIALSGGVLFGIGSQLGRGCTSGAALSGMAVLSSAGFITMMAIFGTGFLVAYFMRKFWI
ncbi:MAG: YeeE/YedE family protein [Bacteroidales bacterium]|nr:YeeE/YedE family protein [Bacteroidales bacterium]